MVKFHLLNHPFESTLTFIPATLIFLNTKLTKCSQILFKINYFAICGQTSSDAGYHILFYLFHRVKGFCDINLKI